MRIAFDIVHAKGHENVKATHKTTFEITTDPYLTPRGDCIIGIKADKAVKHLSEDLKNIIKSNNSIVVVVLEVNNLVDVVVGLGSSKLTLGSDRRIVFRRSTYTGDDTVMIKANKAACDLRRDLIKMLQQGSQIRAIIIGIELS